ncbi:(R)-hydratase [Mesorhizobium sp. M2A.F.Ca.ET.037.01.1.1]|uniref:MaoC family dehydratase n=1 Tax=unclassified Mesorhizobium TaxID=325217 RepID=UPI000F752160|nr:MULTISPECIES: MaoC family dehydratase [unclassified Mesorhizobium]RUY08103.1 (R)-hydratase [Mesorhizobium sp. M2A.F.Ca.ET.040.01.1.1]RVC69839.1 (R)-hydratase [Mesorhizobium sp. M00.F.Ca.ET.038.03.1.1]RVC80487.1 (R)-hydratase [Mesorhizobium sp. M2A.F.Ca.ET.046.02.1.1]AZO34316.1 (R)-hydratase [Mesorhizobium sp. M2A.F.Ca.ET.046.03.2.1]RUX06409.1 (R)-hydratase [Mesorhizobium sp. M2A.F.Ca.ET.037.01.1.1]
MSVDVRGKSLTGLGLSYEDVEIGDHFETPSTEVTAAIIEALAEMTGDRFEIHMSDEAAHRHGFPARVAHGLLVLSLVDGLKNNAVARFRAVASLGWSWRFSAPVLAGDIIKAEVTVAEKRATRNPARAIVRLRFVVCNQWGRTVQEGENELMIYRRDMA